MIEVSTIAAEVPLPPAPPAWFDYGYVALVDGRLALIRTRKNIHADSLRWLEAVKAGDSSLPHPAFWDGDIRISVFDGVAETDVVIVPSTTYPIVDRMPDGRWLVASSRAAAGSKNGRIYGLNGREEQAIVLGDGISHLLCSPDGTFWVGYFDEGIFALQTTDGDPPVSSGGIVQLSASGNVLWSHNHTPDNLPPVDDCYAMTLSGSDLWACFYTDFPILSMRDGKAVCWPNRVAGASAIAVSDNIVLLGGGYGEAANHLTLVQLQHETSRKLGSLRFMLSSPGKAKMIQGRGNILHIVSNDRWLKLSVDQAMQALQRHVRD